MQNINVLSITVQKISSLFIAKSHYFSNYLTFKMVQSRSKVRVKVNIAYILSGLITSIMHVKFECFINNSNENIDPIHSKKPPSEQLV